MMRTFLTPITQTRRTMTRVRTFAGRNLTDALDFLHGEHFTGTVQLHVSEGTVCKITAQDNQSALDSLDMCGNMS